MLIPKKSLGQNFLLDHNIRKKISKLIKIKNETIIEIGAGTGQLTDEILKLQPKKLILIEKDLKLFQILKEKFKNNKLIAIINSDVLFYDFNHLNNIKVFSNLPYNLSVNIIINLLVKNDNITEMIFTLQKEVADKLDYKNKKNNKYRFIIESLCHYEKLFQLYYHF